MNEVVEDLQYAAGLIQQHKDRIIIEDEQYGSKFEVTRVRVIGAATDDPGMFLKVRRL